MKRLDICAGDLQGMRSPFSDENYDENLRDGVMG